MLDIFLYAGRAIMPLLLMMALGCGLRRVGRWSDDFYRQLNGFCFHVLLPVQLFLNVYAIEDLSVLNWRLLGTYRGFELNIRFDSFKNEHQAVLRAELSYPVSLGDDARGNITRLDNAIDNFADRIADAENALQNLEQQKQAAEVEVAKPFAQEEELAEKSARLAELNALLNIDRERSPSQDAPEETEEEETPAARPSVLAALEEKTSQPEPVKPFKSYLDKEGR